VDAVRALDAAGAAGILLQIILGADSRAVEAGEKRRQIVQPQDATFLEKNGIEVAGPIVGSVESETDLSSDRFLQRQPRRRRVDQKIVNK